MVSKTFALIVDGVVENVILWDGVTSYSADGELIEIDSNDNINIGSIYKNNVFTNAEMNI